jgi:hypothetical protein
LQGWKTLSCKRGAIDVRYYTKAPQFRIKNPGEPVDASNVGPVVPRTDDRADITDAITRKKFGG